MKDILVPALLGALGGAGVAFAVWKIASAKLDAEFDRAGDEMLNRGEIQLREEIRRTIDREIPGRVRTEMDAKFREVGLNANSGRQIAAILNLAENTGLIGLRR